MAYGQIDQAAGWRRRPRASLGTAALAAILIAGTAVSSHAVECRNSGAGTTGSAGADDGGDPSNTACGSSADASGAGGGVANTAVGVVADASGAASANTAIGGIAKASGDNSRNTAAGRNADASGPGSSNTAIGDRARAIGSSSKNTATGRNAEARGNDSNNTATGALSDARGTNSINTATGGAANASGDFGSNVALGRRAKASGARSANIGIGQEANAGGGTSRNIAIGAFAEAQGGGGANVGIGQQVRARGGNSVAIGREAQANWDAGRPSGFDNAIAIGTNAAAPANGSVAAGLDSQALGAHSAAFGSSTTANGNFSVALGRKALASANRSVAIGHNSVADVAHTVSVGAAGNERRIVNVADAINPTDAVNLGQLQAMLSAQFVAARSAGWASLRRRATRKRSTHAAAERTAAGGRTRSDRNNRSLPERTSGHAGAGSDPTGEAKGSHANVRTARAAAVEADNLELSTIVGWANIKHDGSLSRSRNIAGSTRHQAGAYEIAFAKGSLRHCTYSATRTGVGFVSVELGSVPNSLKVETRNHYGVLADAAFYVMAVC